MTEQAATTGGPAYPIEAYLTTGHSQAEGMSLRVKTAIAAMQGLLAADPITPWTPDSVAESAFAIADAMLRRAAETNPLPYDATSEWEA